MASSARIRVRSERGWLGRLVTALTPTLRNVTREIEADIKRNAPVDSGELVGSVRRRGTVITIDADHWHFVEYGTKPHIIRPRVKKALWWPDAHHPVKKVYHPGTAAQPYIRPAVNKQRRLRPVGADVETVED